MFVLDSNSVAIKKGKRDGTTEFAHKFKPFLLASRLSFENTTRKIVKRQNSVGIIAFLIEIIKKFILEIFKNIT